MNPRFLLALVLASGLAGLYFSDRALRRMGKMDDVVLRGQTGLPWIDDFLSRRASEKAKRAAYEAELKKLLSAVSAASTFEQRIAANYAVAKLESAQGRSDSRHARRALLAITREGKSRPETVEAWQDLVRLASGQADGPSSVKTTLEGYLAAVNNMAHGPAKLARLQDVWRQSERHRISDLELAALEALFAEFPREPEALDAYEALAQKYRWSKQTEKLPAVEQSAKDAREMLMQRSSEKRESTSAP